MTFPKPDILPVAQAFMELRPRRKGELWGCCPVHKEKTPSFKIDVRRNRYHCFGCGIHGDALDFLTKIQGMSFADAKEHLGIVDSPEEREKRKAHAEEMAQALRWKWAWCSVLEVLKLAPDWDTHTRASGALYRCQQLTGDALLAAYRADDPRRRDYLLRVEERAASLRWQRARALLTAKG